MTQSTTAVLSEVTSTVLSGMATNINVEPGMTSNASVMSDLSGMTSNTTTVLSEPPSFYIWTAAFIFLLVIFLNPLFFLIIIFLLAPSLWPFSYHHPHHYIAIDTTIFTSITAIFRLHHHHPGDLHPRQHPRALDRSFPQKNVVSHQLFSGDFFQDNKKTLQLSQWRILLNGAFFRVGESSHRRPWDGHPQLHPQVIVRVSRVFHFHFFLSFIFPNLTKTLGWVGSHIWENFPKKKRFFVTFPCHILIIGL